MILSTCFFLSQRDLARRAARRRWDSAVPDDDRAALHEAVRAAYRTVSRSPAYRRMPRPEARCSATIPGRQLWLHDMYSVAPSSFGFCQG